MVLAIIQARLGSARLPRKSLVDIGGQPMIERVIERTLSILGVGVIVVAVPAKERDEFASFVDYAGVDLMAPDVGENNVLARFAAVVREFPYADTVMRITGDCPLLDPKIAGDVLELYRACHAWYAWNVYPGYTDGEDVEVFKPGILLRADRDATDPDDREHVTPWLRRHYPVVTLKPRGPQRRKTSIDTEEDLAYVRALIEESR